VPEQQDAIESGRQHHAAGRLDQAEAIYQGILAADPDHAEALALLGLLYYQMNRWADATAVLRRAVAANGDSEECVFNLGLALGAAENWAEAAEAFQNSIKLSADYAPAYNGLGNALRNLRRYPESVAAHQRAVALRPESAGFWSNLGIAIQATDRYPESISAYRKSLAINPESPEGWCNLANALWMNGELEESAKASRRALEIRPDFPEAYSNLGIVLHNLGDYAAAREAFERGLQLQPESANLRYNFSMLLLLQAEFRRGWQGYEWRRRVPGFRSSVPQFSQPMWDGGELSGRTILIYTEQGFGDAIHFARYLPSVAQRGGKIILRCHSALIRLFSTIDGVNTVVPMDGRLPEFDFHCPLLSLPYVLDEDMPWHGPYLHGDPRTGEKFADLLRAAGTKLKVGLIWSGRGHLKGRSIPPEMLGGLANERVQFYSLQVDRASVDGPPAGLNLIDAGSRLGDFADTAALMEQLDLVVSIDTAAAQLAGALARPVWTLLKFVPDWRWLLAREDSPWYPTMRLFRQTRSGRWEEPISRLAQELRILAGERGSS
jgi:tetratricopeptide (TPR) repeat protein